MAVKPTLSMLANTKDLVEVDVTKVQNLMLVHKIQIFPILPILHADILMINLRTVDMNMPYIIAVQV